MTTGGPAYRGALLRAALRGMEREQALVVTVVLPSGRAVEGRVVGMGSLLGVVDAEVQLHEDMEPSWVVRADVITWPQP